MCLQAAAGEPACCSPAGQPRAARLGRTHVHPQLLSEQHTTHSCLKNLHPTHYLNEEACTAGSECMLQGRHRNLCACFFYSDLCSLPTAFCDRCMQALFRNCDILGGNAYQGGGEPGICCATCAAASLLGLQSIHPRAACRVQASFLIPAPLPVLFTVPVLTTTRLP